MQPERVSLFSPPALLRWRPLANRLRSAALTGALLLSGQPILASQDILPQMPLSDLLSPSTVFQTSKDPLLGAKRGLATEIITITSLDDVKLDAVGVLPAAVIGVPENFWGDSDSAQLADLMRPHRSASLPEVTALKHHILMAELPVPVGHTRDGNMLLARLDHLLAAGALDQAEALLSRSGTPNAALFRRWFDVSLLTGRAERACQAMLGDAGLTPTLQARVFCLFRSGDWAAAALTLRSAESLGKINRNDADLLSMFLDPDLYIGEPDPPYPSKLTPLVFTLREALALPRSGKTLPLAYLQMDLQNYAGWRQRLEAAERLVRSQAVASNVLLEAYNEAQASASGGIWARVRAVQSLRAALADKEPAAVAKALPVAYQVLAGAELEFILVDMIFPQISTMELSGAAAEIRFRLALISDERATLASQFSGATKEDQFLLGLALGNLTALDVQSDMQQGVLAAFTGTAPRSRLLIKLENGRIGASVLQALDMLSGARLNDPVAVETALNVLIQAGFQSEATTIALQLLILNRSDAI